MPKPKEKAAPVLAHGHLEFTKPSGARASVLASAIVSVEAEGEDETRLVLAGGHSVLIDADYTDVQELLAGEGTDDK
ncbi:MAG: hypothetical protein ACREHV_08570 [Rhizomicrobium sp.]